MRGTQLNFAMFHQILFSWQKKGAAIAAHAFKITSIALHNFNVQSCWFVINFGKCLQEIYYTESLIFNLTLNNVIDWQKILNSMANVFNSQMTVFTWWSGCKGVPDLSWGVEVLKKISWRRMTRTGVSLQTYRTWNIRHQTLKCGWYNALCCCAELQAKMLHIDPAKISPSENSLNHFTSNINLSPPPRSEHVQIWKLG